MSLTPGTSRLLNEPGAFEAFVRENEGKYFGTAFKITRDPAIAHEIVQESYRRLWEKLPTITSDRSLGGYCMTMVRNLAIDHHRRHIGWATDHNHTREMPMLDEYAEKMTDPDSVEDILLRREEIGRVRRILDLMMSNYREVLYWQFYCGLTPIEIAEKLGISREAAKSRFDRARRSFRAMWMMEYGEEAA